jgi:hypothetical protein
MKNLLTILLSIISLTVIAQDVIRENIGSNGTSKTINNIYFNQSIGQQSALNGTVTNNNITLRQGFQQPVFKLEKNTLTDITELDLVVYPNPFRYDISVKFDQQPIDKVQVSIFDKSGRIIKNLSFNPQIEITIPCKELARGSYVLNIITSNKKYSTNIIKQ